MLKLMNEELNGSDDEDDFEVNMPQWRTQELQEILQIEDPEVQRLRLIERHNELLHKLHGIRNELRDEARDPHPYEELHQHDHEEFHQHRYDDLHQDPDEHHEEFDGHESENSIEMVKVNSDTRTGCSNGPSPKRPRLRIRGSPDPSLSDSSNFVVHASPGSQTCLA